MTPITDWTGLPLTLTAHHLAAIYGLHLKTVRTKAAQGDPGLPAPAFDHPWRWRKADVKRHYETASPEWLRKARRQHAA